GGHLRDAVLRERRGEDAEHLLPADLPARRPVWRCRCLVADAQAVAFAVEGPADAECAPQPGHQLTAMVEHGGGRAPGRAPRGPSVSRPPPPHAVAFAA